MESQLIRVAIFHRDGLYRDSLERCLAQVETIVIVPSASVLDGVTDPTCVSKPDVRIQEFGLCRQYTRSFRTPHAASVMAKTIVIGVPDKEEDILACIEQEGAAGYLLMDASLEDLVANIHAVMKGETLCSPRIASLAFGRVSRLVRQEDPVPAGNGNGLTRREIEIAALIEHGLSNKEIAARLRIELSTVKNHVHNILDKLQLHNRHSAASYMKAQGLTVSRL